jgi:hypothetical protein
MRAQMTQINLQMRALNLFLVIYIDNIIVLFIQIHATEWGIHYAISATL